MDAWEEATAGFSKLSPDPPLHETWRRITWFASSPRLQFEPVACSAESSDAGILCNGSRFMIGEATIVTCEREPQSRSVSNLVLHCSPSRECARLHL